MKQLFPIFLAIVCLVGCRNNPSTSAFPSVGQMMLAPFHHTKDVAQSYYFTGVPDDDWTPLAKKCWKRDGTNFLGVYMGMIAELDGQTSRYHPPTNYIGGVTGLEFADKGWMETNAIPQGVMMFSATSGQLLKWISYEDFKDIFVFKTKPEYPSK